MDKKQKSGFLNILLADDDKDDRFFFDKALKEIALQTQMKTVADGEQLMTYLSKKTASLPNVLFLDLNMPRKNGMECLFEIKSDARLKQIPVVIYSTSLHEDIADLLYEKGAHYYLRKPDFTELKKVLFQLLTGMVENKFVLPDRTEFIVSSVEV